MNPEAQKSVGENKQPKHFSKSYVALLIVAVLVLIFLIAYRYKKNTPVLTLEQENIQTLYKTIPPKSDPNPQDMQALFNSIPTK